MIDGLNSDTARIKYRCAKVLRIIAKQEPELLYPYWDTFSKMLDNDNNIIKWEGIFVLGYLASVDKKNKIEKIIDKYLSFIDSPTMITTSNAIKGLGLIAKYKPEIRDKIIKKILTVENGKWDTPECKNIIFGQAIDTFREIFPDLDTASQKVVLEFTRKRTSNPRNSTENKAKKFIKSFDN
jgi:hypothetical protein